MSSSSPPDAPASESLLAPDTPYRGLTPYSEQDAPLFFGRDDACEIVIDNMMASRLTLLYGASGVGKTSLLRAGVTHELLASSRRNIANYGSPEFVVAYFNRWSDDPVAALTRCVQESVTTAMGAQAEEPEIPSTGLAETLHTWTTTLGSDLLIILDQFEEYFLYHPDDDGDGSFAVELPRAVNRADLRVSFLVAIREDALARLDRFKGRIPNLFDNYLRTRHLDAAAARAAIEKPLEAYNRLVAAEEPFTAEPELVQMVLDQVQIGKVVLATTGRGMVEQGAEQDVVDHRIETPYLQLVLTRLWREEVAAGSHTLRAETLRRLGGAQQIVRTHLDEALGALPGREQDVAAAIFHHLVTPSGTKIAHTAPDLADYARLPEAEVVSVLEDLSRGDARILRPIPPPFGRSDDTPAYEIFHDVLAPAVLGWWTRHTEARAAEARLGEQLEQSAEEKQAAEARARHYRRLLTRVSVIALVLLLALMSTVAVLAVRAADTARSGGLAAEALAQLDSDPASSVRLALDALDEQQTPEAESALGRALSASHLRVVFHGHRDTVTSVAVSPDGDALLTASVDRMVRMWDASTGQPLASLTLDQPARLYAGQPQFSPDGRTVLIVDRSGRVQLWSGQASDKPVLVSSRPEAFRAAIGGRDGNLVATGHFDGTVRLFRRSAPDDRPLVLGTPSEETVTSLVFSPDGRRLAAGSDLGTIWLWDLTAPGRPLVLDEHQDQVGSMAFSADSSRLVSGSDDTTARLWDARSGRELAVLRGASDGVFTVAFSPNGRRVVTASVDTVARVHEVPSGNQVAQLAGHTDELYAARFSFDGQQIVTASNDGTGRLWDARSGGELAVLRGHAGQVIEAVFSPDGSAVFTGGADNTARRWDIDLGRKFGDQRSGVNSAAFDAAGRQVVTAGGDSARVYEADTGRQLAVLREPGDEVNTAAFDTNGTQVVTAGVNARFEGVVRVWTLAAPAKGRALITDPNAAINTAQFSPDGQSIVTTSQVFGPTSQTLTTVWDLRTGKPRVVIRMPRAEAANPFAIFADATFSPDGSLIATAQFNKLVHIWRARTGELVHSLAHSGIVYSVGFSPDGGQVVAAAGDATVRTWDVATGQERRVLNSPSGQMRSAAFSPDGSQVVGGAANGDVVVWHWASGRVLAVLRHHVTLVNTALFRPSGDGKILTASDDRTARLFACESCRPLEELVPLARKRARLAESAP